VYQQQQQQQQEQQDAENPFLDPPFSQIKNCSKWQNNQIPLNQCLKPNFVLAAMSLKQQISSS
jgi:hypothetical protein